MSDKNYRSLNLIKRKKRVTYLKIGGSFAVIVLFIWGMSYLSNLDSLKIKDVQVSDTKLAKADLIKNIVDQEVQKKYYFIFSRNNIIFLPRNEIAKRIKAEQNSIKDVEIDIKGINKIFIKVEEHEAVGVWCSEKECYFLNNEGYIFSKAPLVFDNNLTRFAGLLKGDLIGQIYSDTQNFKNLVTLVTLINKINIKIKNVISEDGTTFYLNTEPGVVLLYEKNDDPEEVANNLNLVIEKDAINKAQLNNIEYIDLRFGNKVPYKIR